MTDYPALNHEVPETKRPGQHLQRTMRLLETSTFAQPNTVRILFYGQSIMGGQWHLQVEDWLRQRYPSVRFQIENRSIGGFSTTFLWRSAESDLYPFAPDLMVLHVFGDHRRYEELICRTRQWTTAEIMIMNDHWKGKDYVDGVLQEGDWGKFMNLKFLPAIAQKYQCELVDVRGPWLTYLKKHAYDSGALLRDNVHLNEHGKWLMAELCKQHWVYRPGEMSELSAGLMKEYQIGEDIQFDDGRLELDFYGNRVDLIASSAGIAGLQVCVDGQPPSAYPDSYYATRTTGVVPPDAWPLLYRVILGKELVAQRWTLEILEADEEGRDVRFRLAGSVTGPEGEGRSSQDFVSDSGQIRIEAEDWRLPSSVKYSGQPVRPGMKSRWEVRSHGVDYYFQPTALGREVATTLFQVKESRSRRLVLKADGEVSELIHALRVYRPGWEPGPFSMLEIDRSSTAEPDLGQISDPTPGR